MASTETDSLLDTGQYIQEYDSNLLNPNYQVDSSSRFFLPMCSPNNDHNTSSLTFEDGQSLSVNDAHSINRDRGSEDDDDSTKQQHITGNNINGTLPKLQAQVLIEDATYYRSIHHRLDEQSLLLYRIYYSTVMQSLLSAAIFVVHVLAFIEFPSSLAISSDVRQRSSRPSIELPCGVTEAVELCCLMIFTIDLSCKAYLVGARQLMRSRWLLGYGVVLAVSYVDWTASVTGACAQTIRVRRILRPFFLLQNSSIMKKAVNCLRHTMPDIISVLLLLVLHLFVFTLFGLLLFPTSKTDDDQEGNKYFPNFPDSFINLLVLLTTSNNPDVMMPAYSENRFYAIYFIVFIMIGMYCLMNMLTAVVYNQFRGYFLNSIQGSIFRRKLGIRAAFEVLKGNAAMPEFSGQHNRERASVSCDTIREVVTLAKIKSPTKNAIIEALRGYAGGQLDRVEFSEVFQLLDRNYSSCHLPDIVWADNRWCCRLQRAVTSRPFAHVGTVVACVNVICVTVEVVIEYDASIKEATSALSIINLVFTTYYVTEQCLKTWAMGWRRYFGDLGNAFDCLVTTLLVVVEALYLVFYGISYWNRYQPDISGLRLYDLVRMVNMLIIVRLLRVIPQIPMMSLVASTFSDLCRNLRAFAGVLAVLYYMFAMVGMELFLGVIHDDSNSTVPMTYECGTYQQLDYWANNFDDFASSLVILWDVMVENNWFIFLRAFSRATTRWSEIYFVLWWLLSVHISLNLFTAIILENFIMRWDRKHGQTNERPTFHDESGSRRLTLHEMFSCMTSQPSELALISELQQHLHHDFRLG